MLINCRIGLGWPHFTLSTSKRPQLLIQSQCEVLEVNVSKYRFQGWNTIQPMTLVLYFCCPSLSHSRLRGLLPKCQSNHFMETFLQDKTTCLPSFLPSTPKKIIGAYSVLANSISYTYEEGWREGKAGLLNREYGIGRKRYSLCKFNFCPITLPHHLKH